MIEYKSDAIKGNVPSRTARKWAESKNLDVIEPKADELFLDLDGVGLMSDARRVVAQNLELARELFGPIEEVSLTPSKSKGYHMVLKLPRKFSAMERLLLQACLGSDLRREMRGLKLIQDGDPSPILFFEPRKALAASVVVEDDVPF